MDNIIIQADADGHHIIINKRNLKYNRLISNVNAAHLLRKNTVIVDNTDVVNVIIESDYCGNNTLKSFDEYAEEEIDESSENIFQNILKKNRQQNDKQTLITDHLSEKRNKLQQKLKSSSEFYHSCNYIKAIEIIENALYDISTDLYPDEYMLNNNDMFAIKFALVLCNIQIRDYKRLKIAEEILNSLVQSHGLNFPSIYYYLGVVYYEFDYYDTAVKILKDGMTILEKKQFLNTIFWPGTEIIMVEKLSKIELLNSMIRLSNECIIYHPPDNKCLYDVCEFNNKIYFTNPNFQGFVSVHCSHKCYFSYHTTCWKKKLKRDNIKAKSLLKLVCPTDDCGGNIDRINTYDEKLKLVNCTSYEAQSTRIGYDCNPVYRDYKFQINENEKSKNTSLSLKEDESVQDLSSNVEQIKSEISTPDPNHIKSKLNSNAKEYVPRIQKPKMCDQFVQSTEYYITQTEYDTVKCDIAILQAELFKSEESYNELLTKFETLKLDMKKPKADFSTQTDISCNNCLLLEREVLEKNIAHEHNCETNERLKSRIKELEHELNELKTARILDKQMYIQAEEKFLQSNKILMQKLKQEKDEKEKLWHEFNEYKNRQDTQNFYRAREIILQHLIHIKNFYMSYINMFQNKCKHMIWELEDIKTLTTTETIPSVSEVEDNLIMWKQALESALKNHGFMIEFYNKTAQTFYNNETPIASFIPTLIPEPPSVIFRHFKSFLLLNKRLEQDINRHLTNYYKLLSIPCPLYTRNQNPNETESENAFNIPPPPGLNLENMESTTLQDSAVSSDSSLETVQEASAAVETVQEAAGAVEIEAKPIQDCTSENTESENIIKKEKSPETSTPVKQVVGSDGLLFKLQQKCPLTPPSILQEAIKILREARGGLDGLNSTTLFTELRIIIHDLYKKERRKPGFPKINIPEKPNPWAPINTDVQWHNANRRGDCTICLEKMAKSDSTQLNCQHVFHTKCIKKWFLTNGICPICRSFSTLESDYPPLK